MRRREFSAVLLAAGSVFGMNRLVFSQASASAPDDVIGPAKGPWRRLFLDGAVVERREGLVRRFHAAEKVAPEPLIRADRAWEGKAAIIGPYVYGTVLRVGDRWRMWYQVLHQGNQVGVAESLDGLNWTKPDIDVVKYEGQPTNLVVSPSVRDRIGGECHNPVSFICLLKAIRASGFVLYGFDPVDRGPRVAFSSDGLHWSYANSERRTLFSSSDVVNFGFDPYQQRTYATWKTRNRRGRAVGIAWSRDGLQWSKPFEGPIFTADDHDPDTTQIYGMPVFPYQGLYIGLPWMYRARYFKYGDYSVDKLHEAQSDSPRNMEVQLAWSWDQVNWTRPIEREQFIARGPEGAWDHGMIVTARSPLVIDDRLMFYYGGTDGLHDDRQVHAGIGVAALRLDGFCSMANSGTEPGWMITRREPMRSPRIVINAKTERGGSIRAELLDRKDRVIQGFSADDCRVFQGDSVRHELSWTTQELPPKAMKSDVKIRFILKAAELFSYLPLDLDPAQPDLARFPATGP
ncbi:MAG: hypothetical protein U0892_23290 [Pirellulales bacterium]